MNVIPSVRALPARVVPLPGESLISLVRRTAAPWVTRGHTGYVLCLSTSARSRPTSIFSALAQFWTFWRCSCGSPRLLRCPWRKEEDDSAAAPQEPTRNQRSAQSDCHRSKYSRSGSPGTLRALS